MDQFSEGQVSFHSCLWMKINKFQRQIIKPWLGGGTIHSPLYPTGPSFTCTPNMSAREHIITLAFWQLLQQHWSNFIMLFLSRHKFTANLNIAWKWCSNTVVGKHSNPNSVKSPGQELRPVFTWGWDTDQVNSSDSN